MPRAWSLGLVLLTGVAGCGGSGGGVKAPPVVADYTWGDVMVHVASTSAAPRNIVLQVTDLAQSPNLVTASTFQSATRSNPFNGAYATALYDCASPAVLQEITLSTCASQGSTAMAPGCLSVLFRETQVTGNYVLPDGSHCMVQPGPAIIQLPVPGGAPSEAATGSFMLECADGASLQLDGQFEIFAASSFLLCSG